MYMHLWERERRRRIALNQEIKGGYTWSWHYPRDGTFLETGHSNVLTALIMKPKTMSQRTTETNWDMPWAAIQQFKPSELFLVNSAVPYCLKMPPLQKNPSNLMEQIILTTYSPIVELID